MALCPKLEAPADIAAEDLFVVPHRIDADQAERIAGKRIRDGVLRPEDIGSAEVQPPVLAYVPFWRLELAVDGMHVSFPVSVSTGERSIPVPLPGYRHRESVTLVLARRLFPYPPNHVEHTRGRVFGGVTTHGGWTGIDIRVEDMVPCGTYALAERAPSAEIVEPDVTRVEAEREAGKRLSWNTRPANAIYADYRPEVRSAACCHAPLHIVRYTYRGHAAKRHSAKHGGETFWVTVCGRTGDVVGGHHPSAVRSVARKIRKWLTFD
jgi:hypothetical protein